MSVLHFFCLLFLISWMGSIAHPETRRDWAGKAVNYLRSSRDGGEAVRPTFPASERRGRLAGDDVPGSLHHEGLPRPGQRKPARLSPASLQDPWVVSTHPAGTASLATFRGPFRDKVRARSKILFNRDGDQERG
jgi:hypothetical protein